MRIVRTNRYLKDMKRIGATEADVLAIESMIVSDPACGDVIRGLRGVRKLRFGLRNKGRSGGGRAIYVLMVGDDLALLLTAYAKNEKTDLTPADRKVILSLIEELHDR